MSNQPSTWYQEQWDTRVHHQYQSKGFLTKGMTMAPVKIEGKKLHFNIQGKGIAQPYTRGDAVKTMNATKGEVAIDAKEWDASEYIYTFDLDRMAANQMDAEVETASMALGRRHDLVLYELMQAKDFNALGQVVGTFTTAFGPGEMLKARRQLFNLDVPVEDGMNFCGLPPLVMDTMMSYEVFANSDWTGGNIPFAATTRKRTWQNINFFELPPHLQSVSTNAGKFYVWHKSALGTGYTGEEIRTAWLNELAKYKRWLYTSTLSAGAVIIESATAQPNPGIIECRYDNSIEPTFD